MKQHISFPSIGQFRNVVTDIHRMVTYVGNDEAGEPIYNASIKKPKLTFHGTVKLHGTNAGICYNAVDGFWAQSRTMVIASGANDNHDFALYAEARSPELIEWFTKTASRLALDLSVFTLALFGEWAGTGIQKGVGVSLAAKAFYIFGLKVSNLNDPDDTPYWVDHSHIDLHAIGIRNMHEFETYSVEVDFNMPQLSQNRFAEITARVEKECPVAKQLSFPGQCGEGVVWITEYKGRVHRFKVKGEKHSVTKVKTLASVDVEKLASIQEFVAYAVTENRIQQGLSTVFGSELPTIERMGDLLRWVVNDITKEEADTLTKNGLVAKDVNKYLANKARELFIEALDKRAFA